MVSTNIVRVLRLSKTLWLLEYQGKLYRTRDTPLRSGMSRKNRGSCVIVRYIICKTLKVNDRDIQFLENKRSNGQWYTEWKLNNGAIRHTASNYAQ